MGNESTFRWDPRDRVRERVGGPRAGGRGWWSLLSPSPSCHLPGPGEVSPGNVLAWGWRPAVTRRVPSSWGLVPVPAAPYEAQQVERELDSLLFHRDVSRPGKA